MAPSPTPRRARLAWALAACALGALVGAGAGGFASAPAACAQVPTTPAETIVPTVGPVDATCSRVPDTDGDSVFDYEDNCQGYFNPRQQDTDNDSGPKPYEPVKVNERDPNTGGDACDIEDDGDGAPDVTDNCERIANRDQADTDGDGKGDLCDESPGVAAAAAAKVAPKLTVGRMGRVQRLAAIRAGVTVPVRCSAPCILTGTLVAGKRTLGTGGGGLVDKGSTFVFVRVGAKTLRTLAKARRTTVTLKIVAADDNGRTSTATRKLVLAR